MAQVDVQRAIDLWRGQGFDAIADIGDMRRRLEEFWTSRPLLEDVRAIPGETGGVRFEWLESPGVDRERAVLHLHGGGYMVGSIATHRDLAARIGRAAGGRACLIDYRLAPEHPFPAAIEDAAAAYRGLLSSGVDPARLAITGDSAGGGMVVALLVLLRDAGEPLPAAAVAISPWADLANSGRTLETKADVDPIVKADFVGQMAGAYLGSTDPRTPLASPLYADLGGLPPLLIQVGSEECLLDDSVRLSERMHASGGYSVLEVWQGMIHVWHQFAATLPEARHAIDLAGAFLRAHTS